MSSRANGMDAAFVDQAAVDVAFNAYICDERALRRSAHDSDDRTACHNCGGRQYRFGTSAGGDAGARVCSGCGAVEPVVVFYETMYGRNLPARSSNCAPITTRPRWCAPWLTRSCRGCPTDKRIHHWHERISQLLLLESSVPPHHLLAIGERILDGSHTYINKDVIRAVLRSLGLQVYIEKYLSIIHKLTRVVPPAPGGVVLQQLDDLFLQLQRPFAQFKSEKRRNFINYNYVFCRLFQKLGCAKFCMFFPLIRSKPKLKVLDETWHAMVTSIGWDCPPLEHVPVFSVRIDDPAEQLERLRLECGSTSPAEPPSGQGRMKTHTLLRQTCRPPATRSLPVRSAPPAPPIPSLALRLKRKRQEEGRWPQ